MEARRWRFHHGGHRVFKIFDEAQINNEHIGKLFILYHRVTQSSTEFFNLY